jgi:hypothetical protein
MHALEEIRMRPPFFLRETLTPREPELLRALVPRQEYFRSSLRMEVGGGFLVAQTLDPANNYEGMLRIDDADQLSLGRVLLSPCQ